MLGSLFSGSWYRVAGLRPRLRGHAQIHRHHYRGQAWYVLQDPSTNRFHRFSPAAYFLIGQMDGRLTVQEIWDLAASRLGDDSPTQDEVIQLLAQLHGADVLQCDVPPDTAEMLERRQRQERRRLQSRLMSPFAWQIPLFDPEWLLSRLLPFVRPFIGWVGMLLWLAVVVSAVILAAVHWSELTHNFVDRVFAPQNLLLLWLLFPVLKALHELGHGLVIKALGGEVHEMGVMIIVLTPLPYVDASAASALRNKWQRIAVGGAGMVVELFIAALALFVWVNAEPGTIRLLAYNTVLIAGITTVLFNGNPLIRFDGYYMLADLLEIPNLASRAKTYVGYLCERYLFGRREAEPPPSAPGERGWLATYALASSVYRAIIIVGIALFLLGKFFLIGVILAVLAAVGYLIVPIGKGIAFVLTNPRLRRVRTRAVVVSASALALVVAVIAVIPAPLRTQAEGVIWIPEESFVRAGTEGFIERVLARPGARVRTGDVLFESRDPALFAELRVLSARLEELEARYSAERVSDLVKAEMIKEDIDYVTKQLTRARERSAELIIRSDTDGTFVCPLAQDLPGRFVRQGELLAHVVDLDTITARAVVSQADIDLVRWRTLRVDVRPSEHVADVVPAVMTRIVPGATERLPSKALGTAGGGQVAIDPLDTQGATAIKKVFEVDLELPAQFRIINVGGRVHVRFDHGWQPLVGQWYRRVRQLFLSRLNV